MTDDAKPLDTLPSPAKVGKVRLAWVEEGLEPLPSFKGGKMRDSLKQAVEDALTDYEGKRKERLLPWLRAGTGAGPAVLNIQGILLLSAALEEGADK